VFVEYDQCGREHYGAGPNCCITNPHLATPEWHDRGAAREAAKATKAALSSSAAVALKSQRGHPLSFDSKKPPTIRDSFAFSLTAVADSGNDIAQVSEKASRIAGRADYKDRTTVNTGSANHICNDFDKFVKFKPSTTRSRIRTRAGVVKVKATGTIVLFVLQADGKINAVRFTKVLTLLTCLPLLSLTPRSARKNFTTIARMRRSSMARTCRAPPNSFARNHNCYGTLVR
jgi:hypothetical protein